MIISIEEHRRLKPSERQVMGLENFSDADIALLEKSRASEEAKAFNTEVRS